MDGTRPSFRVGQFCLSRGRAKVTSIWHTWKKCSESKFKLTCSNSTHAAWKEEQACSRPRPKLLTYFWTDGQHSVCVYICYVRFHFNKLSSVVEAQPAGPPAGCWGLCAKGMRGVVVTAAAVFDVDTVVRRCCRCCCFVRQMFLCLCTQRV